MYKNLTLTLITLASMPLLAMENKVAPLSTPPPYTANGTPHYNPQQTLDISIEPYYPQMQPRSLITIFTMQPVTNQSAVVNPEPPIRGNTHFQRHECVRESAIACAYATACMFDFACCPLTCPIATCDEGDIACGVCTNIVDSCLND